MFVRFLRARAGSLARVAAALRRLPGVVHVAAEALHRYARPPAPGQPTRARPQRPPDRPAPRP